ncbi:hypothetical protein BCR42DRAFT_398120 [Absidia repens]|uniref:Uncharacterized protein n=1 Tax=Absidia repens TaxID=90262 RepID=A0A1X2HZ07_9FUNG|nr:hypothetical protein BCR42DRAFT_398120 [Absidia repens]
MPSLIGLKEKAREPHSGLKHHVCGVGRNPESRLLEAKQQLESMRLDAVLVRGLHRESVKNNQSKVEQLELLGQTSEAWKVHDMYKEIVHNEFFPVSVPNAGTGANLNILASMPCLVGFKEKAREPHGDLYHHVKPFVQPMEGYFTSLSLNIDAEYPKYMDLTLGNAFMHYVYRKLEKTSSKSAGWNQVKKWLVEFTDTPKQKVKDINELFKLTPGAGETIEDFSRKLFEMGNHMELQAISLQELLFMTTISRMPIIWQDKILQLVFASKEPIMKKKIGPISAPSLQVWMLKL